jgi:hypothetical protein
MSVDVLVDERTECRSQVANIRCRVRRYTVVAVAVT